MFGLQVLLILAFRSTPVNQTIFGFLEVQFKLFRHINFFCACVYYVLVLRQAVV